MNKDLIAVFEYLEKEKGIKRDVIIGAIEESLRTAARKSVEGASNVTVHIDPKTGKIDVFSEKEIVDEVEIAAQEILLEEARSLDPDCQLGQFIDVVVTPKNFGRIAAQKARQIIGQKLRGAEREVIHEEYRHRINELISGSVKRFVRGSNIIVDLGKVEALMPMKEYPKIERYNVGEKVFALLKEVRDTEVGGAEVILSRSDPEFVRQLMIQEVPELNDGTIVIDKIVRDAGYRTKFTVRSIDQRVDPVGACVGMRGIRVKNVMREVHNEKIDIIPYSNDAVELLQNALSPIEIRKVSLNEEDKVISIVIDDDDYAATLGKRGMNAKLNGQLIGYEIEIQRMAEYRRSMTVQRTEMAESDDPSLKESLSVLEGINPLVYKQLIAEGLDTPEKVLKATPEQLAAIPGIGAEVADLVLEQVRKRTALKSHDKGSLSEA